MAARGARPSGSASSSSARCRSTSRSARPPTAAGRSSSPTPTSAHAKTYRAIAARVWEKVAASARAPGAADRGAVGENRTMPKGYRIAHVTVNDPGNYPKYRDQVGPIVRAYNGRILTRGGRFESPEGSPHQRHVIVEFASVEKAKPATSRPKSGRCEASLCLRDIEPLSRRRRRLTRRMRRRHLAVAPERSHQLAPFALAEAARAWFTASPASMRFTTGAPRPRGSPRRAGAARRPRR